LACAAKKKALSRASPKRLWDFTRKVLGLGRYFAAPGDGRKKPQIAAQKLLWAIVFGQILRECSFHALEALVRSPAQRSLQFRGGFGDDALAYFTARLAPAPTRGAACTVLKQAKRNKAFENVHLIGMAVDGTGAGRSAKKKCALCHPIVGEDEQVHGYLHYCCLATIVGAGDVGLSLPFDVEPYGPGDSELYAGIRLVARAAKNLGPRFADYVTADAKFACAPFLNPLRALGLHAVVRLKANLPELSAQVQARFAGRPPDSVQTINGEQVEIWDADDFDPWQGLEWETVRVIRYRQHKKDGAVVEADWLTDLSKAKAPSRTLYLLCKSRWEVENQGFNDAKTRYGLEHIRHHNENSLLVCWLLTFLALTIERLFRVRYLKRGNHPPLSAIALVRVLRLCLGRGLVAHDDSG
jgi:hypothetical protein